MTLIINPKFEQYRQAFEHINVFFRASNIEYTCSNYHCSIKLIKINDQMFCVKHYGHNSIYYNIAQTLFRKSKGKEAYLNAALLRERGIQAQEPVAYVSFHSFVHRSIYFICSHKENQNSIEDLYQLSDNDKKQFIEDFAKFVAIFHIRGFFFNGNLLDNILFHKKNTHYDFSILDTNGIHLKTNISIEKAIKNFMQWEVEKSFLHLFIEQYLNIRSCSKQNIDNLLQSIK